MMETLKGLPLLLLLSAATCAFCADGSDAEILYFQHSVARIYEGKYSEAAGGLRSDGLVKDSEAVMNLLAEQFETFVQSFERLYGKPETDGKVTFIGFHNETDGSGVDYYFGASGFRVGRVARAGGQRCHDPACTIAISTRKSSVSRPHGR